MYMKYYYTIVRKIHRSNDAIFLFYIFEEKSSKIHEGSRLNHQTKNPNMSTLQCKKKPLKNSLFFLVN